MALAIIALGGNAVITPKEKGTIKQQLKHVNETIKHIKPLFKKYQVIITFGNGPAIGNLLIQQEKSKKEIPKMPLDVLGAMTQGQLGYLIQKSLDEKLKKKAATIVTQIIVDKKDEAFRRPSKPIGPYYRTKTERYMIKEPEGWRKIVASPKPKEIVELAEIKTLIKNGFTVISCGGGGIPVTKERGKLNGVEAVIDKDRTSALLATKLKADLLIILTDVDSVYLNYESRNRKRLKKTSAKELKKYMSHFKEGSMKPKIEAAIDFLKHRKKGKVIITEPRLLSKALKGQAGTLIT